MSHLFFSNGLLDFSFSLSKLLPGFRAKTDCLEHNFKTAPLNK